MIGSSLIRSNITGHVSLDEGARLSALHWLNETRRPPWKPLFLYQNTFSRKLEATLLHYSETQAKIFWGSVIINIWMKLDSSCPQEWNHQRIISQLLLLVGFFFFLNQDLLEAKSGKKRMKIGLRQEHGLYSNLPAILEVCTDLVCQKYWFLRTVDIAYSDCELVVAAHHVFGVDSGGRAGVCVSVCLDVLKIKVKLSPKCNVMYPSQTFVKKHNSNQRGSFKIYRIFIFGSNSFSMGVLRALLWQHQNF